MKGGGHKYEVLNDVGRDGFTADAAVQRVQIDMVVFGDEELALLLFLLRLLCRPLFRSLPLDVFRSRQRDFLLDGLCIAGERLLACHGVRRGGLGVNDDNHGNIRLLLFQATQVASLKLQITGTKMVRTSVGFFALWETDSAASRICVN